ncbi:hypothetical protein [Spiroplasma endosymbiont of Ammophila pubescens]|uniref:hypothetical protein n=1 Tax=Spiroplasma endosymbiont of Ammophila pubescens TaxID=3066315 RepID=UPI0032B305CB
MPVHRTGRHLNKINKKNESNFNNSIVKVVSCEFEFNYQIKYKKQIKIANFTTNFNITNNNKGFNILKKGIINYFDQKISSFFINKQLIEFAEKDFKTLYNEFKIDLKVNENNVNDIFTKILQNFIKENNIEGITYNKGKFINLESYLFNDIYDRGDYHNDIKGKRLEHQLNLWIKKDEKEEDLINNFIQQYKTKIVPKLNGKIIELAKFSFNMNYINIYGLSLNGRYQYTSGKNFFSTF